MATAAVPRAPVSAAPIMTRQPVFNQMPQPMPDDAPEDQVAPQNAVPSMNPRGPVFNAFPQPQVVNPAVTGEPTDTPGVVGVPEQQDPMNPQPTLFPGTVSTPGMIAAPPPQPGQNDDRR
jgi:hypothetical protein